MVRKALKNEFEKEPDFKVLAEASDGEEAVKLVAELTPDVVIMDIGMSKLNGIEATRQIKTMRPETIVLVLTVYDDIEHIIEILKSGADGYLTKKVLVEDIIKATRSAAAGETVISPQIFQEVLRYAFKYSPKSSMPDARTSMSLREIEVIKLVAKGMSNKEIAHELNLGPRTVKSHLLNVYTKLKVFSRTEAVIAALREGVIKLDDLSKQN